jgi:S-DNA-T family DNA segregation ATPase FtsK/SpoIIIE
VVQLAITTAALDPSVRLTLFDPKQVELAPWAGCADRLIGPSLDEATEVVRELLGELDARYAGLLANRRRKVHPDDGLAMHLIVFDELAFYTDSPDRKASGEFSKLLRDLASRAPAAAMPVIAAAHKPSSDVVPTSVRDMFGFRWALRCSTPQASDTILGQGWAAAGYSAATIDPAQRGVGFLLAEGGVPVRTRTFYLTDDELHRLARHAEQLRATPVTPTALPRPTERQQDQDQEEGAA